MKKSLFKFIICTVLVFSLVASFTVTSFAASTTVIDRETIVQFYDGLHHTWTPISSSATSKTLTYTNGYSYTGKTLISERKIWEDPESGDQEWEYVYRYNYTVW